MEQCKSERKHEDETQRQISIDVENGPAHSDDPRQDALPRCLIGPAS